MQKCSATTKKGTPCTHTAVPVYNGLCRIHFDSKLNNSIKENNKSNPACKVSGCKHHSFTNSNGYCTNHWFEFGKETSSPPPPKKSSSQTIANAFRDLEMEPTYNVETVRAKFREMIKRPDIRIAFTNVEITPETQRARSKFIKLKTAFDLLKSAGRA